MPWLFCFSGPSFRWAKPTPFLHPALTFCLEPAVMNFNEYPVDSLMYITNRPEIVFTHGKGSWLYDNTGKRYLDFIQGWAVNSLGHCNEGMIEAMEKQARTLINPSPAFYNAPMAQLAGLLTANSCFDKV